jgi:hypothetical protein
MTALTQDVVQPYFAVELLFDNEPLRLWTGIGDRTINSTTYTGSGDLMGITGLDEVNDLSAKNATLTLTGIPSTLLSIALQEPYQRRKCNIYLGEQSVSEVVQVFSGKMNTMKIVDEAETSTIEMVVDSKMVELERASNWRYTDENHKSRYAGDTFFSYVQSIQDVQIAWGRKTA